MSAMNYLDVSECTPGEWEANGWSVDLPIPRRIIECEGGNIASVLANARLIAEAGTVAHLTGKGPKQLADERDALLEALKDLVAKGDEFFQTPGDPCGPMTRAFESARTLTESP